MKRAQGLRYQRISSLRATKMRVLSLIEAPLFWLITLWGTLWILGGATLFYTLEHTINASAPTFLDCLGWSVGVVTTTGAGNIAPITPLGKALWILMMMGGAIFLWSYIALFVGVLVDPELRSIEKEVHEIQHDVLEGERLLNQFKSLTAELERHLKTNSARNNSTATETGTETKP